MKVTKIRTALAAFAAVGVIAATGAAGVASAAIGDTLQTPSLEPSAQTAQLSTPGTRLPVVEGYTIARVTGHSTGDGPADEQECKVWGDFIDMLMGIGNQQYNEGNWRGASATFTEARRAESQALGRGCFIIW